MTIRKNDDGSSTLLKWGMKESSYRICVFVLVISMHPIGRQLLGTFGFKFPDEQKVAAAVTTAAFTSEQVNDISKDLSKLKEDVKGLATKVDRLDTTVTGFQIDFAKYQKVEK